jgi:hypothetical protein
VANQLLLNGILYFYYLIFIIGGILIHGIKQ